MTTNSPEITLTMRDGVLTFAADAQAVAQQLPPAIAVTGLHGGASPLRLSVATAAISAAPVAAATVEYSGDGWAVTDRIEQSAPGQFRVERLWRNLSAQAQEVVLSCELLHLGDDLFSLIPAVSYNGNRWGGGREPKGFYDESGERPRTWVFGGDRVSVPGCTISQGAGYAVALYTTPDAAAHSGCSMQRGAQGLRHGLMWPLQEAPSSYVRRDSYGPGIHTTEHLDPGAACTRTFFVVISPVTEPHGGYGAVLDAAWERFYHHVPAQHSPQQLWSLGVRFAKEQLWVESDEFVGFSIGLTLRDGAWVQRPDWRYEIGWCGQNAGLAAMLLQDFLWHGDEESWRRGAATLDHWSQTGRLASGLFYTNFDHKLAGIANPELDTCNLGHGAYHFLLASELAEKAGRPRALWRETGLAACDFFVEHALPNGKLGKLWTGQGECQDPDGTIGCSVVWPLTKAYRMTGNDAYLHTAMRAYRAYADDDLAQLRCTAGALDTDCIDKETAFALLLPGVELYELTGDRTFLQQAEKAAYYLASWQWHYSLAFAPGTPAAVMGYDTFGGTSVSVQHHHLDPWGALIALGWLRLARASRKAIWRQRGAAAWRQASIGVSDGSLVFNGIARPAGGQDEGFYHTRWSGQPGYKPGEVSDWLVAWPTAFRLITLQHWSQWDDLGAV